MHFSAFQRHMPIVKKNKHQNILNSAAFLWELLVNGPNHICPYEQCKQIGNKRFGGNQGYSPMHVFLGAGPI